MAVFCNCLFGEIIIAVLLLIITFLVYAKYVYKYWSRNNIPELLERPHILFGNSKKTLLRQISVTDRMTDIYKEFKTRKLSYGGYYTILKPELIIIDPELVKDIMLRDFEHFTDRGMFSDPKNDPLTAHLFSLGGQKWRELRIKLTPTFTSGKMRMMFNTLVACSDELNVILEAKEKTGEPLDVKEYLARFTIDVIGSCAFGLDCNCLKDPDNDFRKYGQMVFERRRLKDIVRGMGGFLFPNFYKLFKIKTMNPEITDFFIGVVKETVKYREENNIQRKDFMQLLMEIKNDTSTKEESEEANEEKQLRENSGATDGSSDRKNGLTIEEIAAQSFLFFIAGFETSSTTMTFCLYELVKNPEIQEKLREEIVKVMKKYDGKLTYEGIMEMQYMDKVIYEALRKYPPVSFLFRKCTKDYKLPNSDYVLRKGTMVRIPVLGLQTDPEYYPEPEKFDPERFSPEEKAKRHPFTWLPFGEGPRICIGVRFGMMQTKVGLSVLLKNYRFTLNGKTQEPIAIDPSTFITSIKGGVWLDLHKV